MSQPKQGAGGEAAELSLPCTAPSHMGKLRHRWGCATASLRGGVPLTPDSPGV